MIWIWFTLEKVTFPRNSLRPWFKKKKNSMMHRIREQGNKRDMKRWWGKAWTWKPFTVQAFVLLRITRWFTYFHVSWMFFAFKCNALSGKLQPCALWDIKSGSWTPRPTLSELLGGREASCSVYKGCSHEAALKTTYSTWEYVSFHTLDSSPLSGSWHSSTLSLRETRSLMWSQHLSCLV